MTFQRFDIGDREYVAHSARDDFAGSVNAQLAVARFERRSMPRVADFLRLLFVASLRRTKDAFARVSFGIED